MAVASNSRWQKAFFMSALGKLLRHLRQGTLLQRLARQPGDLPPQVKVHWQGADSEPEGAAALADWAEELIARAPGGSWLLCLGEGGSFHRRLEATLALRGLSLRSHALADIAGWTAAPAGLAGIVCGYSDAARMTAAARALVAHPALAGVPFEYAAGLNPERAQFAACDEYPDTHFVSPVLLDAPSPYELYAESLQLFEQKCGLRDYLDLYQLLANVVRDQVPGDIAEFGSYRGHSGWLIARTLQALKSDKRLWMFDMFEEFPKESAGVDHFWNRSHYVDFAEVQRKLAPFPNVTLVRGDFTRTLATSGVKQLALAYVDCDSYRATRYLFDVLWREHVVPGGLLVCEDYGHPALLGSRAAVHDVADARPGFRFFSQFSGLYITLKPA